VIGCKNRKLDLFCGIKRQRKLASRTDLSWPGAPRRAFRVKGQAERGRRNSASIDLS
jgi:hypothetical protein